MNANNASVKLSFLSSLTNQALTLRPLPNLHYALENISTDSTSKLAVVSYNGPYCCPFHQNQKRASICLVNSKQKRIPVENSNAELKNMPARHLKKYFIGYFRHILVCSNPEIELSQSYPMIDGKPVFVQESAMYHFHNRILRTFPKRCLVCSNTIIQKNENSEYILWKRTSSMKNSLLKGVECLKCGSLLTFGRK